MGFFEKMFSGGGEAPKSYDEIAAKPQEEDKGEEVPVIPVDEDDSIDPGKAPDFLKKK